MEEKKGTLESMKDWYQNLGKKEKETTSIFAICGDTKNGINEELVMGDPENICLSLAIAMCDNPDIYFLVESSLEVVKEYEKCVTTTQEDNSKVNNNFS